MKIEEAFAYDTFRPGQRELATRVNQSCLAGEILLAEAMSGLGKTAAVLTGAISAAQEIGCKVVYACRTKRQIARVVEELGRIQSRLPMTAASLLSKFDYCLLKELSSKAIPRQSFGWYCWFNVRNNLCSYFLNVGLLAGEFERTVREVAYGVPDHETLLRKARSTHMCPYEIARLAIAQSTLAVVSYHYALDPTSAPTLFDRNLLERSRTILIVDEAHNLRDFLRDLNSATMSLEGLDGAIREAESLQMERAALSLKCLHEVMVKVIERQGWYADRAAVIDEISRLHGLTWLQDLSYELTACSEAAWGSVALERRLPSLMLEVGDFIARLCSAHRQVLVKWEHTLALIDPNPTEDFAAHLRDFHSSILISATMSPSAVFARSLGLETVSVSAYKVPSEPTVSVRTVIDKGVTTSYRLRDPQMYDTMACRIESIAMATTQGIGVFAPSYAVLEPVFELTRRRVKGRHLVRESRGLTNYEAGLLSQTFRSHDGSILFGVQGGRFSEGEDFREDVMGVVVVLGLSLPPPTPMLYAEYAYMRRVGERDSYLMLSRLPALRKAFQAAGRHIRNPGKRGMVFLLDNRFDSPIVKDLMPSWLKRDLTSDRYEPEMLGQLTRDYLGSS